MQAKIFAIAWRGIYTTFQDRNALLLMFAAPLGLSLIMGAAFGGDGDVSISAVPLAIVNQDTGVTLPGTDEPIALGQNYQDAFVPTGDAEHDQSYAVIHDLTDGEIANDAGDAREKVEEGDLAAVLEIPPTFSQDALIGEGGEIDIYYDSGLSVGPSVVISIARAITSGTNAVILAQRAGPGALAALGTELGASDDAIAAATQQMMAGTMDVAQSQPVQLEQVDIEGKTRSFDALQYLAPSMAILFMTFAMSSGGSRILQEQQNWTLQRIISSPTPRWVFMAGNLLGTFVTGLVQMTILIASVSLIAMLMGRENAVWGTDYIGLALMVLAVVFAGTSLGLLIAAAAKTVEQASVYSTLVLFLLGMLGGSFIQIENLPSIISFAPQLTLNYWGIQGFIELSYERSGLSGIAPSLLALGLMGLVFFVISIWRFNRRLDV